MALDHVVVMILPNPRLEIRCNSCRMWVVYNPVWTLGHKAGLPTSWFVRGSSVRPPRRVPRRRCRSRKLNTLEWLPFQLLFRLSFILPCLLQLAITVKTRTLPLPNNLPSPTETLENARRLALGADFCRARRIRTRVELRCGRAPSCASSREWLEPSGREESPVRKHALHNLHDWFRCLWEFQYSQ